MVLEGGSGLLCIVHYITIPSPWRGGYWPQLCFCGARFDPGLLVSISLYGLAYKLEYLIFYNSCVDLREHVLRVVSADVCLFVSLFMFS